MSDAKLDRNYCYYTKPYSEFKYWFRPNATQPDQFDVYIKSEKRWHHISEIPAKDASFIYLEFEAFKRTRPEWYSGFDTIANYRNAVVEDVLQPYQVDVELYNRLLLGSLAARHIVDVGVDDVDSYVDTVGAQWAKCVDWLKQTDFYTAPASTIYHNSSKGGLLVHTLIVVSKVLELKHIRSFRDANIASAMLVALVHDWCKIGLYEQYEKNVKDDITGVWSKVPAYKRMKHSFTYLGHGVSSMYLVQQFFRLSLDEACAIRWHMGEYNVAHNEMDELHQANELVPLVQLLQFADRLSITNY